ncbi:hypothetical protein [Clostridium intestinale]|uniref:Uncharacterized protein n=1 Tax=Clostridium intestinale URNW TaxID=1294142 RepID=U2NMY0_9CLOT|nr:hypothetical protein [Clostridium intestinale]ERK30211.1 hypothetical protein CINTURNW_2305 [Clostridium intestinale URNW]
MTWKEEIFRAFLLAFGSLQIITNLSYLLKNEGIELARRQHQELPSDTSNTKMKIKVICMFLVGVMFFAVSLISYLLHDFYEEAIFTSLIIFSIYALVEALYYKYWKTTGFAIVTLILLLIYNVF